MNFSREDIEEERLKARKDKAEEELMLVLSPEKEKLYRTNALTPAPFKPPSLPRGPVRQCLFCKEEQVRVLDRVTHGPTYAKACSGAGWLSRIFGSGCKRRTPHLHQSCVNCGGTWMCDTAEEVL